jgi:hypothetical protein
MDEIKSLSSSLKTELENILLNLDHKKRNDSSVEYINEVPGAFLIRSFLNEEESNIIKTNVINIHNEECIQRELKNHNIRIKKSSSLVSNNDDHIQVNKKIKIDNNDIKNTEKRRDSQVHIPVHVCENAMTNLCTRLRHFLPLKAGPEINSFKLEVPGREISTFLRIYHYKRDDYSTPHFDRSFRQHKIDSSNNTNLGIVYIYYTYIYIYIYYLSNYNYIICRN